MPGSCYWNMGIGKEKGAVENDEEGIRTMPVLAGSMAWLIKKLAGSAITGGMPVDIGQHCVEIERCNQRGGRMLSTKAGQEVVWRDADR